MQWANAELLYYLFALPLLGLFFWWTMRRRRRLLAAFASWGMIERLARRISASRQLVKLILLTMAFALLIVTLARPQYGAIERPVIHKGLDIIVALDVSTSMLARDIEPSRLARAKDQLQMLLRRVQGDRVGILTFAGEAYLACPLTIDYDVANLILDSVDQRSIPTQGTRLGVAIREAQQAFERAESDGDRVLVLLTDGEDQGSDVAAAVQEAAKAEIKIHCLGIGSLDGAPIELPGGDYKKDQDDSIVTSRLDFTTLQEIALNTGGKAIRSAPTGYLEIDAIVEDVAEMRRTELTSNSYTLHEERFQWALGPAILLLVGEMLLSRRRRAAEEWKGRFQ